MRKTKCKVLSTILTLVFLLANVPVLAQGTDAPELTISYVKFTDGAGAALSAMPAEGSDIRAAVGVRKSGAAAVEASLYLAQYSQDGKLTAIDTTVQNMNLAQDERILVAKGKTAAGTKTLKALLWNGDDQSPMVCAGNFPTAGGIEAVYIDGVQYEDFNENMFSYLYGMSGSTLPEVTVKTTDNTIKAEVSYTYGNEPAAVIKANGQTYTIYFESQVVQPEISNLQLLVDETITTTQPKVTRFEVGAYMYSDYDVNPTTFTAIQENDAFNNCWYIQPGSTWEKNPAWVGEDMAWYSFDINQTAEIYVIAGGYAPTGIDDGAPWAAMSFGTKDAEGNTQTRSYRTFRYDVPVKQGEKKTVTISNMGKSPKGDQYQNPLLVLVKFKEFYNFINKGSIQPGGDAQRVEWQNRLMYDANLQIDSQVAWDRMAPAGWGYHKFDYLDPVLQGGSFVRIANDAANFPANPEKDKEGISFDVTTDVDVYLLFRDMTKPAFAYAEGSNWLFKQNTSSNGFAHSINPENGNLAYVFKGMAHQRFYLGEGQTSRTITIPNTGYIAVVKKASPVAPTVGNLQYCGPENFQQYNPAQFVKGFNAGDRLFTDREASALRIEEVNDQLGFSDTYFLSSKLDNKNGQDAAVTGHYRAPDQDWYTFKINASADIIMLTVNPERIPPAISKEGSGWITQTAPATGYYAKTELYNGNTKTWGTFDTYNVMHVKSVTVAPGASETVTIPTMGADVPIPIILVRFK